MNMGPQPASMEGRGLTATTTPRKTRSMSDGGGSVSKLSPSPLIVEASRMTSKDDSAIKDLAQPSTPNRSHLRGLSLQMQHAPQYTPQQQTAVPAPAPANASLSNPPPPSPKLDHAQMYASPTNILPRRSRGLDFSRAATSLHHSTLAESSPESSPTIGSGRAISIPGRGGGYAGPEQTSTSLWSIMGNQEKMNISSSVGSAQAIASESSSSSDDELMDEDMDDAYVTTPQISKTSSSMGVPFGSPAMGSPASFHHRQRQQRKHLKKKVRGPLGLGFNMTTASLSRSPPSNSAGGRRESISWQANQLHISPGEAEDTSRSLSDVDGAPGEPQHSVIRRVVTRRGNLLPKTKTFARIRAALMEEGAPADAETRREAEVVKQVRESDGPEARAPSNTNLDLSAVTAALSSPSLTNNEPLDDALEDEMMGDLGIGISNNFKQQAMKNSKGKTFWDTFSESSSVGGTRTSPPPPFFLPRGSSSGISDAGLDSPSTAGHSSRKHSQSNGPTQPPSAAEITRRINNKRRRDDDFDLGSFKRRAVSPGLSVHSSPVVQSPMQKDAMPWGIASRPGSNGGEKGGGGSNGAQSESGSGTPATNGASNSSSSGRANAKGRVGFHGMNDTHDGIMRMSIE